MIMEHLTDKAILNYALQNGIIDIYTIQKQIEMNERKRYLEMHKSKIWLSTDEKWYTFVPDATKAKGKRLVKRKTEEEIKDFLVDFYKEYEEPQTIKKTYEEWISKKLKFEEISKQTVDRYNLDFYKYFSDYLEKDIRRVTEDFLDDFIIENIKKYNMKVKAWSNLRTIIRGLFLFAKKKGYTKINIINYFDELELSRKIFNHEKKKDENVIFTQKEVNAIINHISKSNKLNDFAILFAIYTGMRVGEILALRWEDIKDGYIHVNRTQIRYHDEYGRVIHEIRDFPKTEAGIRDVVIVPELESVIKALRKVNPFTEYLFEKNDKCIHKHSVCTRLYYLCDKFQFPRKGMHSLRRFYATKLINAGVEEIVIISQMGHTNYNTTKSYYYKNNLEKKEITEAISKAICG